MKPRVRIAPSPTGYPHIGTIFQALFNYVYAKKYAGTFIVRIEDTDRQRFVEGAEKAIFDALSWAGLEPDESPVKGGEFGPYRQSERLATYQKYAHQLLDAGHAYYCFCSQERLTTLRENQQKDNKPPMYDQHCRNLDSKESQDRAQTESHVIRMKVPANETIIVHDEIRGDISFDSNIVDDQVLLKSDGFPTYHLAVVVDDQLMKITHMVRGEEWISSAPKHVLLHRFFGWDMPKMIHTPLLRTPEKGKLGKRHGHSAVSWYIENGYLKEAVINFLATRVWNHPEGIEIFDLNELIKHFEFKDMHIHGPIVDLAKLKWLNGQWIRLLPDTEILKRLILYKPNELTTEKLEQIWPLIKERLEVLSDITDLTEYFYKRPVVDDKALLKESKVNREETILYLKKVTDVVSQITDWSVSILEHDLHDLQEKINWKPRPAFMTIRLALTGRSATPPLFETMSVIGQTEVIARLQAVTKQLENTQPNQE